MKSKSKSKVSETQKAHALAQLKQKLAAKEALENKHKLNTKAEQKALLSSVDGEASESDELKLMRVNDIDLK